MIVPEVAGFWSYARADDDAEAGRITRLAQRIQSEFALLTGREIQVFVDREDIAWGEEWRRRIDQALSGTAFFISIITPRYLGSQECRRELLTFAGHAESLGLSELLLPVLYVDVADLDPSSDDEVLALVAKTQYEDWRELRIAEEDSRDYREGVNRLAKRLVEISETVAERPLPDSALKPSRDEEENEPGIVDVLAQAEETMPRWNETIESFGEAFNRIAAITEDAARGFQASEDAGEGFAGRLAVAREFAGLLDEPASEVLALGTQYASQLVAIDPGMLTLIRLAGEVSSEEERRDACELFHSVRGMAEASRVAASQLGELSSSIETVAGFSRDLRNPLRQIQSGLQRVMDGQAVLDEWVRLMDESELDCSGVEFESEPNEAEPRSGGGEELQPEAGS